MERCISALWPIIYAIYMSCRGLVTSKISPELFVFMKTKTYVCDINQSLVIMKSMLFTLLLVVLPLQMMAKTNGSTSPVDLKGLFNDKLQKSIVEDIPIRAEISGSEFLVLSFEAPIMDMTITLYKDGVMVRQKSLSVFSGDIETLDLTFWGAGEYSLKLTTPRGTAVYGNFQLE